MPSRLRLGGCVLLSGEAGAWGWVTRSQEALGPSDSLGASFPFRPQEGSVPRVPACLSSGIWWVLTPAPPWAAPGPLQVWEGSPRSLGAQRPLAGHQALLLLPRGPASARGN